MKRSKNYRTVRIATQPRTVYLLSNNLLGASARYKIIELFSQQKNLRLLHLLLSIKGPTVEALAEKLFVDAVVAENYNILTRRTVVPYAARDGHMVGHDVVEVVSYRGSKRE